MIRLLKLRKRISIYSFKLLKLFTLLICLCVTSMPLFAAADTKVYDYANLFSLDEIDILESACDDFAGKYQMDIGIVTTNDAEGKSARVYADDFYDLNGYGYGTQADGLLFLIDMDNREIYISTCGLAIQYFTDSRISKMLDSAYDYVSNQNYYAAALDFVKGASANLEKGIPSNQHSVTGEYQPPRQPFKNAAGEPLNARRVGLSVIASLIVGLLVAWIVRLCVKHKYEHPHYTTPQTTPDDLSVQYTEREDRFVTSHTSRIKIQTNSSSGGSSGRSSTHTSSSGRTHGGGGRKF